ncbi:MAG: hypothetical protein RKR03_02300 [Candidatus Competibacter sp.]|nr:hypothetical protein [Candidatus Competibacter sp.]
MFISSRILLAVVALAVGLYFVDVLYIVAKQQVAYGYSIVALPLILLWVAVRASRMTLAPITIGVSAFIIYLVWAFISGTVQVSDFEFTYWKQALMFAKERDARQLLNTISPPTILYYSFFLNLFGNSYVSTFIGSAFAWAVSAALLTSALENFGVHKRICSLAGLFMGLSPGIVFYSSLVSPEAVFQLLLISSIFMLSLSKKHPFSLMPILASSSLLAFLFLTRPVGLFYYFGFLAYVLLSFEAVSQSNLTKALLLGSAVAPFLVFIVLMAIANYLMLGVIKINPHPYGAYNFLSGTNYSSKGTWNAEDGELAGFSGSNAVSLGEASRNAIRIAVDRIRSDPFRFARFAATDKVSSMWGTDTQGLYWSLHASLQKSRFIESGLLTFLSRICDSFYLLSLFIFVIAFPFLVFHLETRVLALCVIPAAMLAILHFFIEVQGRYHIPFMPFVYTAVAWFVTQISNSTSLRALAFPLMVRHGTLKTEFPS